MHQEHTRIPRIERLEIATGYLPDIAAGRRAIATSIEQRTFRPSTDADWQAAFARFERLVSA